MMSPYAVLVRGARVRVRPSGDADGLGRAPLVTPWLAVGGGLASSESTVTNTNTYVRDDVASIYRITGHER